MRRKIPGTCGNGSQTLGLSRSIGANLHRNIHRLRIIRGAKVAASHGHDLPIQPSDCDWHQLTAANSTMSGIKRDPPCTRKVHFCPGMGSAGIFRALARIEKIARYGAGPKSEMTGRFDEQSRDVAAGAAGQVKCLGWRLCALLVANPINNVTEHT